ALPAAAQDVHRASSPADNSFSASPETYGTSSRAYVALSPWNFVPLTSMHTYDWQTNPFGIYPTGFIHSYYHAGLQLPAGAIVDYMEMNVCDTDATGHFGAWILRTDQTGTLAT